MNKIYISGKIAGLDHNLALKLFCNAEDYLREKIGDCTIINPIKLDNKNCNKWQDFIIRDLKYLADCNIIYMLKGWEDSPGACVEYAFAKGLGIAIFEQKKEIISKYYDTLINKKIIVKDKDEDYSKELLICDIIQNDYENFTLLLQQTGLTSYRELNLTNDDLTKLLMHSEIITETSHLLLE